MGNEQEDVKALRSKLAEARAKARNEAEIKRITEELDALLNPIGDPEKDELDLEIEAKQAEIEKLLAKKKRLKQKKENENKLEQLKRQVDILSGVSKQVIPKKGMGLGTKLALGFFVFMLFIGAIGAMGDAAVSGAKLSQSTETGVAVSEPTYPALEQDGNTMRIISAEKIPLSQYKDTVGSAVWPGVESEFEFVLRVKWAVTYVEGESYKSINNAGMTIGCGGSPSWCVGRSYFADLYLRHLLGEDTSQCLFGGCYTSDTDIPYVEDTDILTSAGTKIVYTAEFYMAYSDEYEMSFDMFDDNVVIKQENISVGNR